MDFQVTRRKMLRITAAAFLGLSCIGVPTLAWSNSDRLIFIEGADADTLDPGIQRSRPTQIAIDLLFDSLVKWKDTQLSDLVPDLAESWSVSEDGLSWTFKLKKGLTFVDGTPFDAEAVAFNLERLKSEELGSPNASLFRPITTIEVVDAHTVVLKTEKPYASLLENLAESSASMNSPTAVKKWGDDYGQHPVGTGAYMLEEWIPGEHIKLKRNDNYFGEKGNFESIVYRPVPEGEARVIELESGNADIVNRIPPEAADRIKANPNLDLHVIPSSFQVFFELNSARPPFNDVRIRKAVNYAIDRNAIVEKILGGYGSVPHGNFPVGVQARVELDPYPYDPELARKLVQEVYPNGFNEPVVIWTPNGRYMKDKLVAEAVQGYLSAIGFKTEFRAWEWASYQKTLYAPQEGGTGKGSNAANMWMLGTSIPTADWRMTRKLQTGHASNLSGYSNKRVDELLGTARTTLDYPKRVEMYQEIQKIVWEEDPPRLFLFNQMQLIGTQKNIEDLDAFAFEVLLLGNAKKK